jgi:hypothetical protein
VIGIGGVVGAAFVLLVVVKILQLLFCRAFRRRRQNKI